jgi:hypothetical protein
VKVRTSIALTLLLAACAGRNEDDAPSLASSSPNKSGAMASTITSSSATATNAEDEVPNAAPGSAAVLLDGTSRAIPDATGTRIAAKGLLVPVHQRPDASSRKIGYLRAGAIVTASETPSGTSGCPGGWRKIEPSGFVCIGDKATSDLRDPIVTATSRRPDTREKLPYMYGTVTRGGPVYGGIPTAKDLETHEPNLDNHLSKWRRDEVSGAGYGLELWYKWNAEKPTKSAWELWEERVSEPPPSYLAVGAKLPNLSGLIRGDAIKIDQVDRKQGAAFIDSFLHEGRRYNVSTDLRLIPADRYRPIKGSDFHGVRIGVDVEFPFALVRKPGGKRFTWQASKKKMIEAGDLPYRAALNLTGKQKIVSGVLHYETKEGEWVDDRHAGRIDPAKKMPKWGKNGEKWIDVNITKQVLVAYEGERAVFATLVSTGEDGLEEGSRSTKKGIFRIHTKYVTTTMDSDTVGEEFELRDVPYVQYFEGGFALHGAYWHDTFGTPKSHGCINLSPEDARRLFFWTEPSLPDHWHGVARPLTGTTVFVHP